MNNFVNNYLQLGQNQGHNCNLNLDEHLKYVDSLVLLKIIDKNTGESIKQNMTASFNSKAFQTYQADDAAPFDFSQSEFLKARQCLLNYLQNAGVELNKADLKNIESVVLELEKNALARGGNGQNPLDKLNMDNEIAKERLITGSMRGSGVQKAPEKLFSRDEIAKMSTAEFIKNEPMINYQLQNGLL